MSQHWMESSFSDVDAAETPEAFIQSLDMQNASAFKRDRTRRALELLDLRPGRRARVASSVRSRPF